ncbi:hypothetical protein ACP275_02G077000 [Erythranthe tilingii]
MAAARRIGNRILKSNCSSVNYCSLFSSNRFDPTIENPILKSNCASVNYCSLFSSNRFDPTIENPILKSNGASVNSCRFFSSNRFDYQLNDGPNKILEKLTNGIIKEVQRLQHEIQDLRCQMDEVIAHQRSEIETRRESERESAKYARIKYRIERATCTTAIGLALCRVYI